jgi:hypothetical protein
VRGDRCGFGWDLGGALREYGQPGVQLSKLLPKAGCVTFGAVPPFPYAAGAGYVLSSRLNRWVGLSPQVGAWVREALGATRDELQWQKFEDTSTGYWLTYSPEPVEYVNIGYWHHDLQCTHKGEEAAMKGGITLTLTQTLTLTLTLTPALTLTRYIPASRQLLHLSAQPQERRLPLRPRAHAGSE